MMHERQVIKGFANCVGYSDCNPYEVIRKVSDITVELRAMDSKQIVFPKEIHVGGFSAHCADNHNQKYEYKSNEDYPIIRARWSKAKSAWFSKRGRHNMSDKPREFYDYNY